MAQLLDGHAFTVEGHSLAKAQAFINKADSLYAKAPKHKNIPVTEVASGATSAEDNKEEAEIEAVIAAMPASMRLDYYRGKLQGGSKSVRGGQQGRGNSGRGRGGNSGHRGGGGIRGGSSSGKANRDVKICWKHDKYGTDTYECADPTNCRMAKVLKK